MLEPITTQSFTLVALLLYAIGCVNVQQIFIRDPYESRRTAMKGSRLLKVLVFYQLLASASQPVASPGQSCPTCISLMGVGLAGRHH